MLSVLGAAAREMYDIDPSVPVGALDHSRVGWSCAAGRTVHVWSVAARATTHKAPLVPMDTLSNDELPAVSTTGKRCEILRQTPQLWDTLEDVEQCLGLTIGLEPKEHGVMRIPGSLSPEVDVLDVPGERSD